MECEHFESQAQSGFFERIGINRRRMPLSGSMELTMRCNLRCVHCYLGDNRTDNSAKRELTTAEFRRILDQIADAGTLWLLLTGGEPLLRPDFLDIYTHARRKGLIVTVFTNGTLLTPQIADGLAKMPPYLVEITLYGGTAETYERGTGIPGSFQRCLRGIELLRERGIRFKLKTVLNQINKHELQQMRHIAEDLGVGFRFDPVLFGGIDGTQTMKSIRLSPEEVAQTDIDDTQRMTEWREFMQKRGGDKPDPRFLYVCGAGVNTYHIDPYGRMSICLLSRNQSYDLRAGSFMDGWDGALKTTRYQPSAGLACHECGLLPLCGQCPAKATLEHDDATRKIDYLCHVGHLRASALGIQA